MPAITRRKTSFCSSAVGRNSRQAYSDECLRPCEQRDRRRASVRSVSVTSIPDGIMRRNTPDGYSDLPCYDALRAIADAVQTAAAMSVGGIKRPLLCSDQRHAKRHMDFTPSTLTILVPRERALSMSPRTRVGLQAKVQDSATMSQPSGRLRSTSSSRSTLDAGLAASARTAPGFRRITLVRPPAAQR